MDLSKLTSGAKAAAHKASESERTLAARDAIRARFREPPHFEIKREAIAALWRLPSGITDPIDPPELPPRLS